MSGDPAQMIATLPNVNENINVDFMDSAQAGGKLFLSGYRGSDPERLWVVNDGSPYATQLLTTVTEGTNLGITALSPYHDQLYFFANSSAGDGLFRSDGTVAGTQAVKILRTGNTNTLPSQTFTLNDKLYFLWNDPRQPAKLYESNGTAAGTNLIWTASSGLFPTSFSAPVNGVVYFGADGKLWRTDGTAAGTTALWTDPSGNAPSTIVVANNKLFFISSGFAIQRLYSANLDGSNVSQIAIPPNGSSEARVDGTTLTVVSNRVLFKSVGRLFSTDGTDAGTIQLSNAVSADPVAASPTRATFLQQTSNISFYEWWTTDGTVAGTTRLLSQRFDAFSTPLVSNAAYAFAIDRSSIAGIRIYESDGTVAGTRLIQFVTAPTSSFLHHVTTFQDRLVIETSDGLPSLWSLDYNTPTGSIGGDAYTDSNRNGTREGFEGYISGKAYIDLNNNGSWDAGELTGSTENGIRYQFDGLPAGHYIVRFDPGSNPVTLTAPAGGAYDLNLAGGQAIADASFIGADNSTVVWGYLFNDANGNQVRDAGEAGIASQTMFLDYDGNGLPGASEPIRVTSADGSYGFRNPQVGTYAVMHKLTGGWAQTTPPGRAGISVTVTAGAVVQAADMGLIATPAGAVFGWVFNDRNNDGIRDSGDTPFANAGMYLDVNGDGTWNGNGEPTAFSDLNGRYQFSSVVPGDYVVAFSTPEMRDLQTLPANHLGYAVTVQSAKSTAVPDFLTNWYYETKPAGKISGHIWSDHNGDGISTSDEPPAWGMIVWLDTNNDGVRDPGERYAITDAGGNYAFPNSVTGTYRLRLSVPSGWTRTAPATVPTTIALTNGQQYVAPDFGMQSNDLTSPTVVSTSFDRDASSPMVQMQLSEDVLGTLQPGDVTLVDPATLATLPYSATGVAFDAQTNTAAFAFPTNLPNGNYRAVLLHTGVSDVAGNTLAADGVVDFFVLHGDGDGNRKVDIADFNLLAGNFGKSSMTFSQGNYDYSTDGKVNILDFNELAANFGQHVEAPTTVQSQTASIGMTPFNQTQPRSRYRSDLVEII